MNKFIIRPWEINSRLFLETPDVNISQIKCTNKEDGSLMSNDCFGFWCVCCTEDFIIRDNKKWINNTTHEWVFSIYEPPNLMGIKRNPRQGDSRLIRILLGAMWLVADWVGDTKFFSVEILDGFLVLWVCNWILFTRLSCHIQKLSSRFSLLASNLFYETHPNSWMSFVL